MMIGSSNLRPQLALGARRYAITGILSVIALVMTGSSGRSEVKSGTLVNPILSSGPDPWIIERGGAFYYMSTRGDRLTIRITSDLSRLKDAPEHVVWRAPESGPNSKSIWAPELHHFNGRWFIYYTAVDKSADDDAHRGIWVLENKSIDPLKGEWIDRGRVNTARAGIDGTTFTVGSKRYFAYSPYVGPESVIAIARMSNPWTLSGKEAVIARPDQHWERQGGRRILEGPAFLPAPNGDIYLAYSGSACWSDDYAIGLLVAKAGSDPVDSGSWHKMAGPALAKSPGGNVWAPGHNGFFTTGGRNWIVYHANNAAGLRCGSQRAPHVQEVTWSSEGRPVMPAPATGPADNP